MEAACSNEGGCLVTLPRVRVQEHLGEIETAEVMASQPAARSFSVRFREPSTSQ